MSLRLPLRRWREDQSAHAANTRAIETWARGIASHLKWGQGTPEGVVVASPGCLFLRTNGGAGTTLYVKESGTGNTGWVGK